MDVLEPLGLHAAIDLVLLGVSLYLLIYEVWLWRGVRGYRGHLFSAIWCCGAIALIVGRILQFTVHSELVADFVIRLQIAAVFPLFVVALGTARAISGRPLHLSGLLLVVALTLVALSITFWTSLLVTDELYFTTGLGGHRYLLLQPGPLAPYLLVVAVIATGYILWTLHRSTTIDGTTRRWWYLLAPICLLVSANDMAILLQWFPTIHLFELCIVGIAVALSHNEVRQYDALYSNLEDRVTERTEELEAAAGAAAENEARFRQLSEASREGVIVHERGTIVDVNTTLEEMYQRDTSSLVGVDLTSLFAEESRAKAREVLSRSVEHSVELIGLRGSEDSALERFPVEVARHEPGGSGTVEVFVLRDLTEQKSIQAQLLLAERMASVGTLAAGTAHEINNPMTYVAANLQFIGEELDLLEKTLDTETTERLRGLVNEAAEGCRRVRRIVQDLKTFSRDGAQTSEAIDVVEVFEATLRIASNEIRHRAHLVRAIDDVPPVLGDEGRIGQVILNLLVNAAQVLPDGHADEHEIRFSVKKGTHNTVVLEVSDTGPGICPEDRATIFEPFFTTKPAGLGLGLSICRDIVTSLGGSISVDSSTGGGALFRVALPAASKADPPRRTIPPVKNVKGRVHSKTRKAKVLIIDDEVMVARALSRALGSDHDVTTVWSGREALEQCAEESFDVILCDLMMPDITGIDVYESLSQSSPELSRRIVFVTGGAFTQRAQDFLRNVPNPHLEKPLDIDALRELIRQVSHGTNDGNP